MATTWIIEGMTHEIADGGVVVAYWRANAASDDDQFFATNYGGCSFTYDPSSPDFIPYDQLTQDEVLGWVWTQVDKDAIEAALAQNIYNQEHPTTASGLPWDDARPLP